MTKKDYEKIAALLKKYMPVVHGKEGEYGYAMDRGRLNHHAVITEKLAALFKEDNPNFKYDRFINVILKQ